MLFPLCRDLGLVQGATPALAERAARYQAETGASQRQTRARLRREHGVAWGVKKLRQVTEAVARAMEPHRPGAQAEPVVRWLAQAQASRGWHRPVLAVGRAGITRGVRIKHGSLHEVARTGTITVYDRRGRRLGTVYRAHPPEPNPPTLAAPWTPVLTAGLRPWEGSLPRLG